MGEYGELSVGDIKFSMWKAVNRNGYKSSFLGEILCILFLDLSLLILRDLGTGKDGGHMWTS